MKFTSTYMCAHKGLKNDSARLSRKLNKTINKVSRPLDTID